jgi:hypothetical protein
MSGYSQRERTPLERKIFDILEAVGLQPRKSSACEEAINRLSKLMKDWKPDAEPRPAFRVRTKHQLNTIEWDQIPSGTVLKKFVACDPGDDSNPRRVVLHGFVDEIGNMYITDELVSQDPVITGVKSNG